MKNAVLIFPHQLYKNHPLLNEHTECYLVECALFFTQYKFHQQKIVFHRASMCAYAECIESQVKSLTHIKATDLRSEIKTLIEHLKEQGYQHVSYVDVTDDWLDQQLQQSCTKLGLTYAISPSQLFLTDFDVVQDFFGTQKKQYFHHHFYQQQRKRFNVLMDEHNQPIGGQWSFDEDNRKKYPKNSTPPKINFPNETKHHLEARDYTQQYFADHLGDLKSAQEGGFSYPITHEQAEAWFEDFLNNRFQDFGVYEDAMVQDQLVLHHSVLTPMLNVGLLSPQWVIKRCLAFAQEHEVPINSLEGFVRQIIGWREFIRGLYESVGRQQRCRNYWQFNRPIPPSFYTGETGIEPVDVVIKKVLQTGYCHHIERLMVLGNFMLLCEFDPDHVHQWFMELFIDAYDWVMVPNVYGMSQFADGGLMATKPYISSSNYILKMSDFSGGQQAAAWRAVWDGLFWRFMHKQRHFFESNPRIGMLLKTWDRMNPEKKQQHLEQAEQFLASF